MKKIVLFNVLMLSFALAFGQDVDALNQQLKQAKHDTTRLRLQEEIGRFTQVARISYWDSLYVDAKKLKAKKTEGDILNTIGTLYNQYGETSKAFNYFYRSLTLRQLIKDKKGIASSYMNIGGVYETQGDVKQTFAYYNKALKIFEELNDVKSIGRTYVNMGYSYLQINDFEKSITCFNKAIVLLEKTNAPTLSIVYLNLGDVYFSQGNIKESLINYEKSLNIAKLNHDEKMVAMSLSNLSTIYQEDGDFLKALAYEKNSFFLLKKTGNRDLICKSLIQIGELYSNLKNTDTALVLYNRSLKLAIESNNKLLYSICTASIGNVFLLKEENSKALEWFQKSLISSIEIEDGEGVCITQLNLFDLYYKQKKYLKALNYATQSLGLAKKLGLLKEVSRAEFNIYQAEEKLGNISSAFQHYKNHIEYRDSINNDDTRKASMRSQINYEFDKKETVYKAAQQVAQAKQAQQRIVLIAITLLLLGGAVFAFLLYKRYKLSQQQKQIIEQQKHLVDEKHKEITDSINYAERIQRALLASDALLAAQLPQHFVLFKPKDVVSGDFYWGAQLANKEFALVVADSTGHGVPGAIMSMLNIASLEKAIAQGIKTPNLLLEKTRQLIIDKLKNDGSAEGGKDGMDATLLCFDFETNTLRCACANNPVWIIRTNELIEIKPDKMPVGKHDRDTTPFTQHEIQLQKGDVIYTFTDGYADQFGGEKGKKFMYKPFKELLLSIVQLPMVEQRTILTTTFNTWKGNLEQVDDVCVMGIRI